MEKRIKFQDNKGIIDKIESYGFKNAVAECYDLANFLVNCGFGNLKFSVGRSEPKYIFDSMDSDAETVSVNFQISGLYDTSFKITTERHASNYRVNHLDHGSTSSFSRHHTPKEFTNYIANDILHELSKAYGNKHTPQRKRPKLNLIKLEDDPYRFVARLQESVFANTEGFKIPVVDEADYVPPASLTDRFLIAMRIKKAPLPALPAPVKTLPDSITTLVDCFTGKLSKMDNSDLKAKAEQALANIKRAVDILGHKEDEAENSKPAEEDSRIFEAFNRQAKRDLHTDLVTISITLVEFDFSKTSDKLEDYLDLINSTLEGRFENVIKRSEIHADDIEQIGMDVSLQQMRKRFDSVERLALD
ncbi:MAG: hypothetical protein ACLFR0_03195 [Alphaproteobacteria bacterium]